MRTDAQKDSEKVIKVIKPFGAQKSMLVVSNCLVVVVLKLKLFDYVRCFVIHHVTFLDLICKPFAVPPPYPYLSRREVGSMHGKVAYMRHRQSSTIVVAGMALTLSPKPSRDGQGCRQENHGDPNR